MSASRAIGTLNHSVTFRFNLQTASITYWAQEVKEKTQYTWPIPIIHCTRIPGSLTGKHTQPDLSDIPPFSFCCSSLNKLCMWLNGETEKCCSHQWELYGLLKWAHSASERSAACVFSLSLNRKRHPRPLAHSLTASIAGSDHQRQTDFISHPPPRG